MGFCCPPTPSCEELEVYFSFTLGLPAPPTHSWPVTHDNSWGQGDLSLRAVQTILKVLGRPLNSLAQCPDLEHGVVIPALKAGKQG